MSKEHSHNNTSHWGKGLALAIALFVCATLGMVAYMVSLDFHLVTENHYEEAVNYQNHIDRLKLSDAMAEPVEIEKAEESPEIHLRFPSSMQVQNPKGTVQLYRPSNPALDRIFPLSLDEKGIHRISTGSLARGKWMVRLSWSTAGKKYFMEKQLFL